MHGACIGRFVAREEVPIYVYSILHDDVCKSCFAMHGTLWHCSQTRNIYSIFAVYTCVRVCVCMCGWVWVGVVNGSVIS